MILFDEVFSIYILIPILLGNIVIWSGVFWQFRLRRILDQHEKPVASMLNHRAMFIDLKTAKSLLPLLICENEKEQLQKSISMVQLFFKLFMIFGVLCMSWVISTSLQLDL